VDGLTFSETIVVRAVRHKAAR